MAMFPCDVGRHMYGGSQHSVYVTPWDGVQTFERQKLRLCDPHFNEVSKHCFDRAVNPEGSADEFVDPSCFCCGERLPNDKTLALFVDLYSRAAEPTKLYGRVHPECLENLRITSLSGLNQPRITIASSS